MAAKKQAKKKIIKKSTKTGTAKKKDKVLKNAPVEHYFILSNGQPVRNLVELAEIMHDLRDEVFNHHVTDQKNDFACWINDILEEEELAKEVSQARDMHGHQIVIYRHIVRRLSK